MKTSSRALVLAAFAVMVSLFTSTQTASAQGNFDAARFREQQLERYRERIEVKSDDDWRKLEPLVGKVMDAQRDARMGLGFGFGGGRGGRGGGGGGGGGGTDGDRNRGNRGGQSSPETTALQKSLDDKASAEEVKANLAKFRETRKAKEAALDQAQDELRKALTAKQEAGAVLAGLLK